MVKHLKKVLLKTELIIVLSLFCITTINFIIFTSEIKDILTIIVNKFGLTGLFFTTLLMDSIIQPISPDLLTMVYTMTKNNIFLISLVGGIASVLAGCVGYGMGYLLEEEGIDKFIGQKRYKKIQKLFLKHGFWAVLVGALSPVPFSAICWSAGIFRMPWKYFLISVFITRLPRFIAMGYFGSLI